MKLYTPIEIEFPKQKIDYNSNLFFIGSCFAENIGQKLKLYKFPITINPCGIAYNPVSIANTIAFVTGNKQLKETDLFFHNEYWHSLHHHGLFSDVQKSVLERNITEKISLAKEALQNATHIFLTLGTSWVFEHIATQQIVNNCHKLPSNFFQRKRLTLEETIATLEEGIKQIQTLNPSINIIFTVSPIRHQKDGFHENQLSKATLLLAIDSIRKKNENIHYFPAYELAIDELRDYRFYAEDLCHLNALGIEYIWEKFSTYYITESAKQNFSDLNKLQKALCHRVQNPNSSALLDFTIKIKNKIAEMEKRLPNIDFSEERNKINEKY